MANINRILNFHSQKKKRKKKHRILNWSFAHPVYKKALKWKWFFSKWNQHYDYLGEEKKIHKIEFHYNHNDDDDAGTKQNEMNNHLDKNSLLFFCWKLRIAKNDVKLNVL